MAWQNSPFRRTVPAPKPSTKTPEETKVDIERANQTWKPTSTLRSSPRSVVRMRKRRSVRRSTCSPARQTARPPVRSDVGIRTHRSTPTTTTWISLPIHRGPRIVRNGRRRTRHSSLMKSFTATAGTARCPTRGRRSRWTGYLTGSDGSTIETMNEHINNRPNDRKRNWGLPE
jgi:hypothetical protein